LLQLPKSQVANFQKLSDIYDLFDPAMDAVIRDHLKTSPVHSRRTWEFSIIFLALHAAGCLHPQARGLAMGAGTERLIYAIAPQVEKVVVTDLYGMLGGWKGLDVPDPQKLIMAKAPWPVAEEKLQALPMDMRDLKFPDDSFDFCWSTGAFEHIGGDEDFIRHLNEVYRVLKPGGTYVFTTACVMGDQTARIPHNYYFNPTHLMDLAHESMLQANRVFDCLLRDHTLNQARLERPETYGFLGANNGVAPLVALRRGLLIIGNSVVLTKSAARKVRPVVKGFARTRAMAERSARSLMGKMWKDWMGLALTLQEDALRSEPQWFGEGPVEAQILGSFSEARVFSRGLVTPEQTLVTTSRKGLIRFEARDDLLYTLRVSNANPDAVVLRARHARV
jgi:SAM-dependent methyltransferase